MNAPETPEPASPLAIQRDVGAQMARLRESFGLTPQEVSERLHIRARYINAMEEGRYELMPGKVYARGYVHTYAEFLGLDPEQIVVQCFAGEATPVAQVVPVAVPRTLGRTAVNMRGLPHGNHLKLYGMIAVAGLVAVLGIAQLFGGPKTEEAPVVSSVAPVPEAMLASVRTMVMPTPANYDCLTQESLLQCFYSDGASVELTGLMRMKLRFAGDITPPPPVIILPAEEDAKPFADAPADAVEEEANPAKAHTDDAAAKPVEDTLVSAPAKETVNDALKEAAPLEVHESAAPQEVPND